MEFTTTSEADRPPFLHLKFRDSCFDLKIFEAARHFIQDYQGCRWDFMVHSSGVPFLRPTGSETYNVRGLLVDSTLAGLLMTHSVLLGMIQDGVTGYRRQHYDLKNLLADYCIESNRIDVLEALVH